MAHGEIIDIRDRGQSRREITVSSSYTSVQRIVLMPGVLDTAEGNEVLRRASDLRNVAYNEIRASARDRRKRE
jgi:hypothetical protein